MIRPQALLVLCVLAFITGCASNKYPVTIASKPSGAEVYCNGQSFGYTPVTRYFTLNDSIRSSGYLQICQAELRWVSGATATMNNIIDLNKFPNGVIWTQTRPNEPNAYIDHQFS